MTLQTISDKSISNKTSCDKLLVTTLSVTKLPVTKLLLTKLSETVTLDFNWGDKLSMTLTSIYCPLTSMNSHHLLINGLHTTDTNPWQHVVMNKLEKSTYGDALLNRISLHQIVYRNWATSIASSWCSFSFVVVHRLTVELKVPEKRLDTLTFVLQRLQLKTPVILMYLCPKADFCRTPIYTYYS